MRTIRRVAAVVVLAVTIVAAFTCQQSVEPPQAPALDKVTGTPATCLPVPGAGHIRGAALISGTPHLCWGPSEGDGGPVTVMPPEHGDHVVAGGDPTRPAFRTVWEFDGTGGRWVHQPLTSQRGAPVAPGPLLAPAVPWGLCDVPVTVNAAAAADPEAAVRVTTDALSAASDATGIDWHVIGTTVSVEAAPGTVVVVWDVGVIASADGAVGTGARHIDSDRGSATAGTVTLRADADLRWDFGPNGWGAVLLHELGHVVGLDHNDDPDSVMNSAVLFAAGGGYGPADLAALDELTARCR